MIRRAAATVRRAGVVAFHELVICANAHTCRLLTSPSNQDDA
jgi:hypothetical protein